MHTGVKSVFVASLVAVTMVVATGAVAQQSQPASQTPGGVQSSPSDQSSPGASPSGSTAGSGQPAAGPSTGQGSVQVDASSIIGSTVRSGEGRDLGKVSRLMVEPGEGRIGTVVIGIGGMLGMGMKEVAVPWNSVKVGQDNGKVVLTVDQVLLQQAPREQGAASPATGGSDRNDKKKSE